MRSKILVWAGALLLGGAVGVYAQSAPDQSTQPPVPQDNKPTAQDTQPAAPAPSLADVAAKDRAVAASHKAKHVFTNDEIPSHPEEAAADASQQGKDNADDADKSGDDAQGAKKPKEEDSVEVKGAKKVIEAKTIQIDAVTDEMHKLEFDLANAKTPDEASSLAQSIRNLQHNLEVWKNVRGDAQKVIDDAQKQKDKDKNKDQAQAQPGQ